MFGPAAVAALGRAELVAGDPERAAAYLRDLPDRMLRTGGQGALSSGWADAIEALIRIGELDAAAYHLERWSTVTWTRLARIGLLRCTGLLADARGDSQAGVETLERAVAADSPRTYPFERAQTLLALGAVRRPRCSAARASALERRSWLRAPGRRAVGRPHPRRTPAGQWPPTVRRAHRGRAACCDSRRAGGRNTEIATTLFIAVGTVESHLSRVYRKLGVRSRTELSHDSPQAGEAVSKCGGSRGCTALVAT